MSLHLAPDALSGERFGTQPPYRIGVEEELLLVHPTTHRSAFRADELLSRDRRLDQGEIVGEICDGMIEIVTPVCRQARAAVRRLAVLRRAAVEAGGPVLMGAGLHPDQPFGAVRHRRDGHFGALLADLQGVVAQSAYCGVHVHVGMPDAETAIAACNGMRRWIPVLQALGANSPFWHGRDSGLASARTVRLHSLPRTGAPRAFTGWDDYRRTMDELLRVSGAGRPEAIWWDVRPQPRLGTLEIRVMDSQSSLGDLEGLVALTHCLVHHEAVTRSDDHPTQELLQEATFRALRDGLHASFSIGGRVRHVHELAAQALQISRGYAARLGCSRSLEHVERLLAEGNGADRQRRAYVEGGMPCVLATLVRETAGGVATPRPVRAAAPGAA